MMCRSAVFYIGGVLWGCGVVGMDPGCVSTGHCGGSGTFFSIATVLGRDDLAIFDAISRCDTPRIRHLLASGVSVDCLDPCGLQAIHCAAQLGCVRIIELLLAAGVSVDAPDARCQRRPLHHAVYVGNVGAAARLIEAGATVDVEDQCGVTPLSLAVRAGSQLMTRLLLEEGADPMKPSLYGLSAYDYAPMLGDRCILRMLQRAIRGEDLCNGLLSNSSTETLSSDCSAEADCSTGSLSLNDDELVSPMKSSWHFAALPAPKPRRAATA